MEKIKRLLKYVSENVPYYINYFSQTHKDPLVLESYPVLCRKDYIDNYDMMISQQYEKENLMCATTSGTTGVPFVVCRSQKDYYNQVLSFWRARNQFYRIVPASLGLEFCLSKDEAKIAQNGVSLCTENKIRISLYDVCNEINASNILKTINEKKPEYIKSSPSAICNYIMLCKRMGITKCDFVRYIESSSEYLFTFQREMMADFFTKAQISNEYGCTEVQVIAQELPSLNGMRVLRNNAYVEILTDDGMLGKKDNIEGDLIVTGLNSFSMPFIRYRIGDRGKIIHYSDSESFNEGIELTAGRINDYIIHTDGTREHCVILSRTIQKCNDILNQIIKFKFVQCSIDTFDLFLTIKDTTLAATVEQVYRNQIKNCSLNDFLWNIHFVDFDGFFQKKSKFSIFERKI